jgi:hypothetical protein
MKKILATVIFLLLASSVSAQHFHRGYSPRYYGGGNWVAPLIGGAILGAVITDAARANQPVQQPPIIIQNPPQIYQQNTYSCLVQIYDPITRTVKNEVMLCVNQ